MSTINRSNPFRVGDFVTCIHRAGNGTGEGVIWEVTKSQSIHVWIRPVYTVTGKSSLKPKKVLYHDLKKFGLADLGEAFQELHVLILEHFRAQSGLPESHLEGCSSTDQVSSDSDK